MAGRLTWPPSNDLAKPDERNVSSGINLQFTVHLYRNCLEKSNAVVKYAWASVVEPRKKAAGKMTYFQVSSELPHMRSSQLGQNRRRT